MQLRFFDTDCVPHNRLLRCQTEFAELSAHNSIVRGDAHAQGVRPDAVRRRRWPGPRIPGRQGGALDGRPGKAATKRTRSGLAVHDFRGLLSHLGDPAMNRITPAGSKAREFDHPSSPTPT